MTPLIFFKRKLPLTLVWLLVCVAMSALISTGYALYDTMADLPGFVEKNNKTVALIGESHSLRAEDDGSYTTKPIAFTKEHYDRLVKMDSVKAVHINTITGAYSDSFYASLPWEAYGNRQFGNNYDAYNNGIVVGRVVGFPDESVTGQISLSLDGGKAAEYDTKMCELEIAVEKLYLFNDVFTENVFSDFKYVHLTLSYYSNTEEPLFKPGDRCIFYIDNYRAYSNSWGPSAVCFTGGADVGYFNGKGLQVVRDGDELVTFTADSVTYETKQIPYTNGDGTEIIYEIEEMTALAGVTGDGYVPVMSKLDGSIEEFLDIPENGEWNSLFAHLERVNGCLPVVGTDLLEGQYAFVTDIAKIVEGRFFTEEEYENGENVMIISKAVAEKGNIKAGDVIDLSQFLLNRDSGRTEDYFSERRDADFADYLVNVNPTVGVYVTPPKFTAENEKFTVVGIYDQSEKWENNMFAFTPNTVFMPKKAQTEGGYGVFSYYEDGSAEPVHGGAEGIGLVVEIKNGRLDDFREEIVSTDMAEFFLTFDQGYEDSVIPARLLASMGRNLFIIVLCGWVLLLVLYVLLYQLKQNRTLGIMRSVGATPAEARRYIFACGIVPAVLGVSVGGCVGMLLTETVQSKVFSLILEGGDIGGEMTRFSTLLDGRSADPAKLIPVTFVQIAIFALVLWACATIVAKRPPRKLGSE